MTWATATNGAAPPLEIGALMAELQRVEKSSARFTERKFISILSEPLESAGTLSYVAPDRLEKTTVSPTRERLVVKDDEVTVDQGEGEPRTFSLANSPELAALIESIRATLSGDLTTLQQFYTVDLRGTTAAWALTLTPKSERIKALVSSIYIAGSHTTIRTVDTLEADGDRTVMTINEDSP